MYGVPKTTRAVNCLTDLLRSCDHNIVTFDVCDALVEIGDPRAVKPLIDIVLDNDRVNVGRPLIEGLKQIPIANIADVDLCRIASLPPHINVRETGEYWAVENETNVLRKHTVDQPLDVSDIVNAAQQELKCRGL